MPMPPRAKHWFDAETETLVYAEKGTLTIVQGLSSEPSIRRIKIPRKPTIHAIVVIDDVAFIGADAGGSMLGYVDLRAASDWKPIAIPDQLNTFGKGIDGFAHDGSRLVAIDDIVLPRYMLLVDIQAPRSPRFLESRHLPAHSSAERILSVSSNHDTIALLSTSANHGAFSSHVSFLDLRTLEEFAVLHAQCKGSIRRWADRSYDLHSVAIAEDHLLIAADEDGIGVLTIPARPKDLKENAASSDFSMSQAPTLSFDNIRFVPVSAGRVVDVMPVDENRAFAIVEKRRRLLGQGSLDSVLVELSG